MESGECQADVRSSGYTVGIPVLLLPVSSKIALQPDSIKNGDRKPLEVVIRHDLLCSMTRLNMLLRKSAEYGHLITLS